MRQNSVEYVSTDLNPAEENFNKRDLSIVS